MEYVKKRPKTREIKKSGGIMDVCQVPAVDPTRWRPSVGAFASSQRLDGRDYENRSTFFSLVPRGKENFNINIFDFLKIGL